jgi:hypothetical protein
MQRNSQTIWEWMRGAIWHLLQCWIVCFFSFSLVAHVVGPANMIPLAASVGVVLCIQCFLWLCGFRHFGSWVCYIASVNCRVLTRSIHVKNDVFLSGKTRAEELIQGRIMAVGLLMSTVYWAVTYDTEYWFEKEEEEKDRHIRLVVIVASLAHLFQAFCFRFHPNGTHTSKFKPLQIFEFAVLVLQWGPNRQKLDSMAGCLVQCFPKEDRSMVDVFGKEFSITLEYIFCYHLLRAMCNIELNQINQIKECLKKFFQSSVNVEKIPHMLKTILSAMIPNTAAIYQRRDQLWNKNINLQEDGTPWNHYMNFPIICILIDVANCILNPAHQEKLTQTILCM